jgi:hypothetical protein
MDKYNEDFRIIISEYKDRIKRINNDSRAIDEYLEKMRKLFRDNIVDEEKRNRILEDELFIKSTLNQLLDIREYRGFDNDKLICETSNCSYLISEMRIRDDVLKPVFFKFQYVINRTKDLLIYDIIAYHIFEYILALPENLIYRHYISKYYGCFLTYIKDDRWNYNNNYYLNRLSPYNYNNLNNPEITMDRRNAVVGLMTEAIGNPRTIEQIFRKYKKDSLRDDRLLLYKIMSSCYDLYEFIKMLGIKYGFAHGDLFMENIIYNGDNGKLLLIDFGRTSFTNITPVVIYKMLNNRIKVDYYKLNYDNDNIKIDDFIELYNRSDKNFSIIYDLMSFSLNMYNITIYLFKDTEDEKILNELAKIIEMEYNNREITTRGTIDELIDNYEHLKTEFIPLIMEHEYISNIGNYVMFLLEGLYYMALFLHFRNNNKRGASELLNINYIIKMKYVQEFEEFLKSKLKTSVLFFEKPMFKSIVTYYNRSYKGGKNKTSINETIKLYKDMYKTKGGKMKIMRKYK